MRYASGKYAVDKSVVYDAVSGMNDAYENALRTVAESYEAEVIRWGGKSLSRVATIVVSSGAFFTRLKAGATFSVANLEKFNAWFRVPANWPDRVIPHDAATALISMGRPPVSDVSMTHAYRSDDASVACDRVIVLRGQE
ncbi:hypothetical protein [Sphingomonas insulae]|nr:hypothetical protein [Sphingomonas insulae]